MRRLSFSSHIFSIFALTVLALGCSQIQEEEAASYNISNATFSKDWTYNSNLPISSVDSNVRTIKIDNAKVGSKIYLAKINVSENTIESSDVRFVENTTGVKKSKSSRNAFEDEKIDECDFNDSFYSPTVAPEFESSRSAFTPTTVNQIQNKIGSTQSFYIDHGLSNGNISSLSKENATLRAVGQTCNVWVVDSYFSHSNYKNFINQSRAENIAQQFDSMYSKICSVYGYESDFIYISRDSLDKMESYSKTGLKINIIVYDIGNDYDSTNSGSIVGYFSAKDYYLDGITKYSNQGKYFYIDSYYASSRYSLTMSTLAHEFQHMINFNQKTIKNNLKSADWYNEMLSMMCEDMIQTTIGISDCDSPKNRLPRFNAYYAEGGLEYNRNNVLLSYATSYAFGSWIARQFGGEKIIKEISQNDSVNMNSVINAVSKLTETTYTVEKLLSEYAQACVFNGQIESYTHPTHNQKADQMMAINLWKIGQITGSGGGPKLYDSSDQHELRPYGMTLVEIGEVTSDSVLIRFNETGAAIQKMYIFIQ